jgi:hypothetical protein
MNKKELKKKIEKRLGEINKIENWTDREYKEVAILERELENILY